MAFGGLDYDSDVFGSDFNELGRLVGIDFRSAQTLNRRGYYFLSVFGGISICLLFKWLSKINTNIRKLKNIDDFLEKVNNSPIEYFQK